MKILNIKRTLIWSCILSVVGILMPIQTVAQIPLLFYDGKFEVSFEHKTMTKRQMEELLAKPENERYILLELRMRTPQNMRIVYNSGAPNEIVYPVTDTVRYWYNPSSNDTVELYGDNNLRFRSGNGSQMDFTLYDASGTPSVENARHITNKTLGGKVPDMVNWKLMVPNLLSVTLNTGNTVCEEDVPTYGGLAGGGTGSFIFTKNNLLLKYPVYIKQAGSFYLDIRSNGNNGPNGCNSCDAFVNGTGSRICPGIGGSFNFQTVFGTGVNNGNGASFQWGDAVQVGYADGNPALAIHENANFRIIRGGVTVIDVPFSDIAMKDTACPNVEFPVAVRTTSTTDAITAWKLVMRGEGESNWDVIAELNSADGSISFPNYAADWRNKGGAADFISSGKLNYSDTFYLNADAVTREGIYNGKYLAVISGSAEGSDTTYINSRSKRTARIMVPELPEVGDYRFIVVKVPILSTQQILETFEPGHKYTSYNDEMMLIPGTALRFFMYSNDNSNLTLAELYTWKLERILADRTSTQRLPNNISNRFINDTAKGAAKYLAHLYWHTGYECHNTSDTIRIVTPFNPGIGTAANPYLINTADDLLRFADYINAGDTAFNNKHYKLGNDIDLSTYGESYRAGKGWSPIGSIGKEFLGKFDGNNKKITNLYVNTSVNGGLFGIIKNAEIYNLGVENVNISTESGGAIVTSATNSKIYNCYSSGTIKIAGTGSSGVIANRSNHASSATDVIGNSVLGGIVASAYSSTIANNYSLCDISTDGYGGGIAGHIYGSSLNNCYATGEISTGNKAAIVGGIVGKMEGGTLRNNVALNSAVKSPGRLNTNDNGDGNYGRVYGNTISVNYGNTSNNYGFSGTLDFYGLTASWLYSYLEGTNGGNVTATQALSDEFWTTASNWNTAAWDNSIWTFADGKLPVLKPAEQGGDAPEHLKDVEMTCTFAGSGTEAAPYQITTADDLACLAQVVNSGDTNYNNKYYILMNNIDLSAYGESYRGGKGWVVIGTYGIEGETAFRGNFNGNGKKITGLYINDPDNWEAGLFGSVAGAEIYNLGVEGVSIFAQYGAGGIVSNLMNGSKISKCYSTGSVYAESFAGGIASYIYTETPEGNIISDCYSTCRVRVKDGYAGGIAGNVSDLDKLINCYSTGRILTPVGYSGGIAAYIDGTGMIKNCVALNIGIQRIKDTPAIGRITGEKHTWSAEPILSGNYAWLGIPSTTGEWLNRAHDDIDGEDISAYKAKSADFWKALGWSSDIWVFDDKKVPVLKNFSGEQVIDISYLTDKGSTNLASLSVAEMSIAPTFEAGRLVYSCVVPNSVAALTVNAIPEEELATVSGTGNKSLTVGSNMLEVIVTSPDEAQTKTYTVVAARLSSEGGAFDTVRVFDTVLVQIFDTVTAYVLDTNWLNILDTLIVFDTNWINMFDTLHITPPSITTVLLSSGEWGASYSTSLEASGDKPAIWALDAGHLPDGLDLYSDGSISGVASRDGSFNFTVICVNGGGNDTRSFSITIDRLQTGSDLIPDGSNRNPLRAWVSDNLLSIDGLTIGAGYRIYSVSGALVSQGVAKSSLEILSVASLARGGYIIQSENRSVKVIIY